MKNKKLAISTFSLFFLVIILACGSVSSTYETSNSSELSATKTAVWLATAEHVLNPFAHYTPGTLSIIFSTPANNTEPSQINQCIGWEDAGLHIGEDICIEGIVYHIYDSGDAYFINFDDGRTSFYGVSFDYIWDDDIIGECIQIWGEITTYENRPQIIIRDPEQVILCP